jgi:hypothetical protein
MIKKALIALGVVTVLASVFASSGCVVYDTTPCYRPRRVVVYEERPCYRESVVVRGGWGCR